MWGGMGSLVEVSSNSCEHLFELFWFYGQLNPDNIASSKHICREVSADDFITHAWCNIYTHADDYGGMQPIFTINKK